MVLGMKPLPVCPRPLANKIHQEHIDKQEDMFPDAVPAIYIDIVSRIVPYLYDGKGRHDICQKCRQCDKIVLNDMQKSIVPSDDINEDQVVDQFHIFDFLFFRLCNVLTHESLFPCS